MMTRITHPPSSMYRARLDNLALLPASLLPSIASCLELANTLPEGGVLIVVPPNQPRQEKTLRTVAQLLTAHGHQVRVMPASDVPSPPPYVQGELGI